LRIDPDHAGALFNLGNLELGRGRLERAEQLLARAASLDGSGAYLDSLGRVYAAQRRWAEAAVAFERSLASDPASHGARFQARAQADLGRARLELGRDAEALEALLAAEEAHRSLAQRGSVDGRGLGDVLYQLARVAARGGDAQTGLRYLERALANDPALREPALAEADLRPLHALPGWPSAPP
jgi:tetratricopeptide (TPR) repeat protein